MMKLGHIQSTLASSNLDNLMNQIKLFNSKNSEINVSLVGTLATKYGDEAVAMALAAAQKSAPSKSIADQFRELRNE
ncbi:hypothetical protein GN958_ATG07656 [Phytophthora infestans]|uniref:Uncharacterized protein n=1 Tax=Phytophthora infestans TaxID=4787 RepID=A0A8S9UQE7_PHYIN|nr:hypothetical protein GN958_ATG07656 [Phytophthora infestans]